jgi:phosphate transport system substrate-binding protein
MTRFLLPALALVGCSRPDKASEGAPPDPVKPVILQAKGSDTMVNLMQRFSEEYAKANPKVVVSVTGGGSGTGIKALTDKTTDLANCSRRMKDEEIATAKAGGVDPVATVVAYDGLSIYVNKENPIASIDFETLKAIYSADGAATHWKDVGVTVDCGGDDTIVKVGRQNNSGTYEYFKEHVIGKEGKFTTTMDQSGTQQVADVVGTTKCAIGYGGMGYASAGSRHLCLSKTKADACVEPSAENVLAGKYPFSRELYVYTNGAPTGAAQEFLAWVRSPAAKTAVVESGFVPLPVQGAAAAEPAAPSGEGAPAAAGATDPAAAAPAGTPAPG